MLTRKRSFVTGKVFCWWREREPGDICYSSWTPLNGVPHILCQILWEEYTSARNWIDYAQIVRIFAELLCINVSFDLSQLLSLFAMWSRDVRFLHNLSFCVCLFGEFGNLSWLVTFWFLDWRDLGKRNPCKHMIQGICYALDNLQNSRLAYDNKVLRKKNPIINTR